MVWVEVADLSPGDVFIWCGQPAELLSVEPTKTLKQYGTGVLLTVDSRLDHRLHRLHYWTAETVELVEKFEGDWDAVWEGETESEGPPEAATPRPRDVDEGGQAVASTPRYVKLTPLEAIGANYRRALARRQATT